MVFYVACCDEGVDRRKALWRCCGQECDGDDIFDHDQSLKTKEGANRVAEVACWTPGERDGSVHGARKSLMFARFVPPSVASLASCSAISAFAYLPF